MVLTIPKHLAHNSTHTLDEQQKDLPFNDQVMRWHPEIVRLLLVLLDNRLSLGVSLIQIQQHLINRLHNDTTHTVLPCSISTSVHCPPLTSNKPSRSYVLSVFVNVSVSFLLSMITEILGNPPAGSSQTIGLRSGFEYGCTTYLSTGVMTGRLGHPDGLDSHHDT